jgi:plastocyanin
MKLTKVLAGLAAVGLLVAASPSAIAEDGATIKGTVTYEAKVRKRKTIKTDADPFCATVHADKPLLSDAMIHNKETKAVQHVFVYVKKGLPDKKYETPTTPVKLDQNGCRYEPRVFGIMKGQKLEISNSDDTAHNIHALPKKNDEFNFSQPKKGAKDTKSFAKKEMKLPIKCDVHNWMKAWAYVMDHPYFAVTNEKGEYEIKGLPPGKYTIEAVHEKKKPGKKSLEIEVASGETKTLDFVYKPKKKKKKK